MTVRGAAAPIIVNAQSRHQVEFAWKSFIAATEYRYIFQIREEFMNNHSTELGEFGNDFVPTVCRIRFCACSIQRSPNPRPNLHSPVWSNGGHPRERVQIWVCLFLYGWYYPGVRLQI